MRHKSASLVWGGVEKEAATLSLTQPRPRSQHPSPQPPSRLISSHLSSLPSQRLRLPLPISQPLAHATPHIQQDGTSDAPPILLQLVLVTRLPLGPRSLVQELGAGETHCFKPSYKPMLTQQGCLEDDDILTFVEVSPSLFRPTHSWML